MRIAIVNDLPLAVEALRRVLNQVPQHSIAWTANDGAEAVQRCATDRPDLVLMDLIMPVMDGVEATRRIMRESPCAILIVTATVAGSTGRVFEALGAGALDAINTPVLVRTDGGVAGGQVLLSKIEMLRKLIGVPAIPTTARPGAGALRPREPVGRWLIALGSSAGGPAALAEVLKPFAAETPAAFVAVSHLDEGFAAGLAEWLGQQIALPVRLARNGDVPEAGVVLLPARDDHLVLTAEGTLAYTRDPVDYVYRPSVDALFESVVNHWRGPAAGVLLTGMGRDGARGLKAMRDREFLTIAQDRATSAVYGMPKAAAELGAAERVLPLPRIGPALKELLQTKTHFPSS